MFDIGFLELLVVSIVGLLVLGPERLPGAIRTVSLWLGKLRSGFNSVRAEIEREIKADEIVAVRLGSVPSDVDQSKATSGDRSLPEHDGAVNHVNFIKHLESIGYDGPVSPSASASLYKGQTRESIVQRAQEAVDGISKEAGLHVASLPMDLIEDIPWEPTSIN